MKNNCWDFSVLQIFSSFLKMLPGQLAILIYSNTKQQIGAEKKFKKVMIIKKGIGIIDSYTVIQGK